MRRNNSKKQPVFGEQLTFDTQLNSDKSGIRNNRTSSGENKRGENRGNKAADILSYIRACGGRLSADELHSLIAELAEEYEKKARAEKETENKTAKETEEITEEKIEETAKKTIGEESEETAVKPDNGKENNNGNGNGKHFDIIEYVFYFFVNALRLLFGSVCILDLLCFFHFRKFSFQKRVNCRL